MLVRRLVLTLLALCCAALLAYTSYRAFRLSFTHDESISYDLITGNSFWKGTANHHPLNTKMMGWAMRWLGTREWHLRLPNVLAHGLFVVFGLLLLKELKSSVALLAGFAFLNLNPFVLEFFSLARGYGLALGLSAMSLFFLLQAWKRTEIPAVTGLLFLSLACASLADLANFSWLNLHLSIFGAAVLVLMVRRDSLALDLNRRTLAALAALAVANAWFIYNLARRIWFLQQGGELYARGRVGFVPDTLGTLADSYFYGQPYPQGLRNAIILLAIVGFVAAVVLVAYRTARDRRLSVSAIFVSALVVAVAAPITEHHVLGVEYPVDRIALFYIPLAAAVIMFLVDETVAGAGRITTAVYGLCVAVFLAAAVGHLYRTSNTDRTLTWAYDAETKTAIADILAYRSSGDGNSRIKVGNNWIFEPTLNFYRLTLSYDWLAPATRVDLSSPDNDLVYCYPEDLQNYPLPYTVLKRYPLTQTVLARIDRP